MDEDSEPVPPSEAARERRRDRRAEAESRAGMRTGLAKLFKQVLDAQSSRAAESGPGPIRPGDTGREAVDRPDSSGPVVPDRKVPRSARPQIGRPVARSRGRTSGR